MDSNFGQLDWKNVHESPFTTGGSPWASETKNWEKSKREEINKSSNVEETVVEAMSIAN